MGKSSKSLPFPFTLSPFPLFGNTGGSPEAVEHGQTGLIFESENPLDLANKLFYLLRNPDKWEAMTRQGQQRALSQFSLSRTVEQLEAALFQLAHQSKSRVFN